MLPLYIAPSILAADFATLGEEVKNVAKAGADWIHVDIMDGHFVPNISFGADVMKAVRSSTEKPFDVHLMISNVDNYLESFAKAGADRLTIHIEAGNHSHRSLQLIKSLGKRAGIALNPATDIDKLAYILDDIDLICVMSVNPGFGGQKYIPHTTQKLRDIKALVGSRPIHIEVDGGVTADNAFEIVKAGANALVAGSSVFKGGKTTYANNINAIREQGEKARGSWV